MRITVREEKKTGKYHVYLLLALVVSEDFISLIPTTVGICSICHMILMLYIAIVYKKEGVVSNMFLP